MKTTPLKKYYDASIVDHYESSRQKNKKWQDEQHAVETFLEEFKPGTRLIDVPVGTGRFLPVYARMGFEVCGVDSSDDMLRVARTQHGAGNARLALVQGDIFRLKYPDGAFEVAICIRFMNLVSADAMDAAMRELGRVCHGRVIVGIRHVVPAGELKVFRLSGLARFLRQCASRVLHRAQGKVVFHHREMIMSAIRHSGLKVAASKCIEHRRDGTDYTIYLLQRS